ncbi:Na(+)/citrate cotransporter-like [Littorina saxatilis]|uniref:Na(+)/citrate cotransporter-like n=1 Tax=Littorina saxatilis TaxID=31220 RepID=UPI0038B5063B
MQDKEAEFSWPMGSGEDVELAALEKGVEEREILVETNGNTKSDDLADDKENTGLRQTKHSNNKTANSSEKNTKTVQDSDDSDEDDDDDKEIDLNVEAMDEKSANLVKALCLSVCYSANIGGVATLTGTGPNIVFKNYVESLSEGDDEVSFVSWMAFGTPVAALSLALTWLWLQLYFFGVKTTLLCRRQTHAEEDRRLEEFLRREHKKLGHMSFAEKVVLGHFVALVLLWLTRSPGVFTGWSVLFPKGYVSDAVPAVLVALSLFVFPRQRPRIFCCRGDDDKDAYTSSPSIVQWAPLSKKFPWGVLLLLGGGFAVAEGTKVSGLSNLIAQQMMVIGELPAWAACVVVVVFTSVTTEITSNTVIATLLLPILAQVAGSMGMHPIYFMLPSAVASSFAFMLPVATPPNAIVFAHGDIKVLDMIKTGTALNIIGIVVVTAAINTFGFAYFNLGQVPDWALRLVQATPSDQQNVTAAVLNSTVILMSNLTTNFQGL